MVRKKFLEYLLFTLAGSILFILAGVGIFYWVLPLWAVDPMEILSLRTPVRVFTDRAGKILYVQRTYEGQWRFHVPLKEIAPIAVKMVLAVEDRNFYRHSGIDWSAVLRAFFQNLSSGSVVSGASTISMQLASMSLEGDRSLRRRSLQWKVIQILRARRLEMRCSKEKILEEYLNRIPMGGNMYGLECGARYYFGQKAKHLNESESALLCGLPQRPNAWRPDRHMKKAIRRRDLVLYILERQKILTPERVRQIKQEVNLRFRSFAWKADFMELAQTPEKMYFDCAAKEAGYAYLVKCAFRAETARALREILQNSCHALPGVTSASGVILDNETKEVIALVGSVEGPHVKGSQINGAFSLRSAGSTLKPFLYAEGISGGMLAEDTLLRDLPVRYGNYVPVNFDGKFRGEVPAWEALADSLNIPAIRLASQLGEARLHELLRSLHLLEKSSKEKVSGLSLALGSAGHTLFALTNAYGVFAGDGVYRQYTFLTSSGKKKDVDRGKRLFVRGTGSMISSMLARRRLPYSLARNVSWKTGTSNGNKDAWCFAWTPKWTVGVWFGNKDNRSSAALNGFEAAAPAAGKIISFLYSPADRVRYKEHYAKTRLCRESGLRACRSCRETFEGRMLEFAPLKRCPGSKKESSDHAIRTPVPGKYFVPEGESRLTLTLKSTCPEAPYWMLNDRYLGSFHSRKMVFEKGSYRVRMIPRREDLPGKIVDFTVE